MYYFFIMAWTCPVLISLPCVWNHSSALFQWSWDWLIEWSEHILIYCFCLFCRYFCDWCPARFDNRSAARIHESTHKGQETKCYVCDKTYADRYSLRYHLRTHGIGRQIRYTIKPCWFSIVYKSFFCISNFTTNRERRDYYPTRTHLP